MLISNNQKSTAHIAAAVNKANKILRLIRSFTYMDIPLMKQLYTSFVGPHLEFGSLEMSSGIPTSKGRWTYWREYKN